MSEDLKKKAQDLQDQAINAKKEKKYPDAIIFLKQARSFYEDLGYQGEVGIIDKEIKRIENLMQFLGVSSTSDSKNIIKNTTSGISAEQKLSSSNSTVNSPISLIKSAQSVDQEQKAWKMELDRAANQLEIKIKNLGFEKKYDEAIKACEELIKAYDALGYEYQIRKVRFDIEKFTNLKKQSEIESKDAENIKKEQQLSIAQERELRLQKQRQVKEEEEKKILAKIEEEQREKEARKAIRQESVQSRVEKARQERFLVFDSINSGQDIETIKKERAERERKAIELAQKKEQEEKLLKEANAFLDLAKEYNDKKDFTEASTYYHRAAQLFEQLGWTQQVEVLKTELRNVEERRKEYEKKLKEEEERRKASQLEFEARAAKILAEKEAIRKKEEEERNRLPPEIQEKIQRAEVVLQKAQDLEAKEKWDKALSRYEYLIELYKEIGAPVADKIPPIEKKVVEIKPKIPPETP